MKMRGRLAVITVSMMFIIGMIFIAKAGMVGGTDHQAAQVANAVFSTSGPDVKVIPVVSWSESGVVTSSSNQGATRVDRDFGAYAEDDVNLFGYDQAYNSSDGHKNRESDYQSHHWTPDTYGHMGNYNRDSNGP